ncbi:MAG: choice-of-anchor Q domain-containing protein [Lentisphaerota bacterium]
MGHGKATIQAAIDLTVNGDTVQCILNNCIVYWNSTEYGGYENHYNSTFNYSCTTPHPGGTGNISNDPQLMDAGNSNFHLSGSSPCIDAGNNAYTPGSYDHDGNPRIIHGTVDIGAYEMQGYWAWVGAITNGLTNYNDCATGDGYPNLLKYATGSCPTNFYACA